MTLDAIEQGDLVVMVNTGREAADSFKLPASLLALVVARLAAAKARNSAVSMYEGAAAGADVRHADALYRLTSLLRNGYAYLLSIPEDDLPYAEQQKALNSYAWEDGHLGDLSQPSRVESLARQVAVVAADTSIPEIAKYPASLASRISNWLGILEATNALASGGTHQGLVELRNQARDLLLIAIARVRHFYCSASDDGEHTQELAKINMQPKRARGDAQPQPKPEGAGTATFNATTHELSIEALPAHATFLRAYRQVLGGRPELAGVSTTPTVSIVAYSPLATGAHYTVWVVGANSHAEGPASNKISVTG